MNKQKRNILVSSILILLAVVFTILVKVVDVKAVGVDGTSIGFATINQAVFENIGVNLWWYNLTDLLGIIPILTAVIYAVIGFICLIKKKSIMKIEKEIIILGAFYVIVMALYIFFENVIINYRPVALEKALEASYPSSHTLMTICILRK